MTGIIHIAHLHPIEMDAQSREYLHRDSRFVHLMHVAHQQPDQPGRTSGERRGIGGVKRVLLALHDLLHTAPALRHRNGSAHQSGHSGGLSPVASGLDRAPHPSRLLAIGGQHLTNPMGIVLAEITQVASHREDEVVSRPMRRHTP